MKIPTFSNFRTDRFRHRPSLSVILLELEEISTLIHSQDQRVVAHASWQAAKLAIHFVRQLSPLLLE